MENNEKLFNIPMWPVNAASLIILGIVIQIGGAYLVNAAVTLMDGSTVAAEYDRYMNAAYSADTRTLIHILFVAPLVEEIVFRILFLRAGLLVLPFWAANLIQAVLFGVYHGTAVQKVYGFLLGLVIGCVFYYCPIIYKKNAANTALRDFPNSLIGVAITFVLHMVINVSGIYLVPNLPADIAIPAQIAIGVLLMMVVACASYMLKKRVSDINAGSGK